MATHCAWSSSSKQRARIPGCVLPKAASPGWSGRQTRRQPTSMGTARAGTHMWRACVTTSQGYADQRPGALPGNDADEQLWEAIAEPSRRRALDLIIAHGEATPTMLAAELPFTRQAGAKHLAALTRAGPPEGPKHGPPVRKSSIADRPDARPPA